MHPGIRVAHYEILAAIGRGGMGEVWKARDARLRREVAIKTLPPELGADPDRLARLEREATLLATLNHPNVAAIYGLEEYPGGKFLVLELVDGVTLEERLLAGRIPVQQALQIALQIAEALEAAHEKGVIHRDLKPANVKIAADERVKVLDFGLAKNLLPSPADIPTQTALRTQIGAVMGTMPYMSPEQARGDAVDRQTDIWSLGVVLYEMLTGRLPFRGDSSIDTLARIIETQPDFSLLPPATPRAARHLLERCLEKNKKRRFQHVGDVRIEIEDALAEPAPEAAQRGSSRLATVAAALVIGALGGVAAWSIYGRTAAEAPAEAARLSTFFPDTPALAVGTRHVAIASDGSRVAFAGAGQLWIRRIRDGSVIRIDSEYGSNPFFSPDGEWIGFHSNGVWKAPSAGGAPARVFESFERSMGSTWGSGGTIVSATTEGLYEVAANGGEPRLVARPDGERNERLFAWPQFLPDGQSVLYTVFPVSSDEPPKTLVLDLQTLRSQLVLTNGSSALYVPTGQLVYASGQSLAAIGFDLERREIRGAASTLPGITIATTAEYGAAEFAVSDTGTLVYIEPRARNPSSLRQLAWVDHDGVEEELSLQPGSYGYPRVSPDGMRLALDSSIGGNRDIWIWELRRSTLTKLTSGPTEDMLPLWSTDGRRLFFASNRAGTFDVYSQAADGATDARVEITAPGTQAPLASTPDGGELIVNENFRDIGVVNLARSELRPLLHNDTEHRLAEVSPDGAWLAYESNESGQQFEIYVRPFPDVTERREKVSINGGRYPLWGPPNSGELYYVDLDGAMMAAAVDRAPDLTIGNVTKLFDTEPPPSVMSGRPYDISPLDGRFLVVKPAANTGDASTTLAVVLNWSADLPAATP